MDITVTPTFAVPIFSTRIPGYEGHRAALVAAVKKELARDPGLKLSNRHGWHSRGDFHRRANSHIKWLMPLLGDFVRAALEGFDPFFRHVELVMRSCWANAGGRGAWNAPHNHMPSHWSGVFYLQAERCREPGDADDLGGLIEFLNPKPMGHVYGQALSTTFEPEDGLALLFPAYLLHYVHPNRRRYARISLSFNIDATPL